MSIDFYCLIFLLRCFYQEQILGFCLWEDMLYSWIVPKPPCTDRMAATNTVDSIIQSLQLLLGSERIKVSLVKLSTPIMSEQ